MYKRQVLVIALIGFTIPTLVKLATPKQKEMMTEVTTLSKLAEPEIKQEEMKRDVYKRQVCPTGTANQESAFPFRETSNIYDMHRSLFYNHFSARKMCIRDRCIFKVLYPPS